MMGVHLQSEESDERQREEQFKFLTKKIPSNHGAIIVGDYNFHTYGEDKVFESEGFEDTWKSLNGL